MRPTSRTQPYRRRQGRQVGQALSAMLRGRTAFGHNPQDLQRELLKRRRRLAGRY